jgi:hypothetical protein
MPPKAHKSKTAPEVSWEVAHLQAIFFPVDSPREIRQDWFREITGERAEQTTTQQAEAVAVGPYQGGMLNLTVDLLRILFTLHAKPGKETPSIFATLDESPTDACRSFVSLVGRWIDHSDLSIKRIGFAGRLIHRTKDQRAGYRVLEKFLPTLTFSPHCSDLLFRINRPRVLKTISKGQKLNRMSTWTVMGATKMAQVIPANSPPVMSSRDFEYACALEFDVSTSQDFDGEIHHKRLKRVLNELAEAALEISKKGDTR